MFMGKRYINENQILLPKMIEIYKPIDYDWMHLAITKHFKKYHIFGFTGTPIFAVNAGKGKKLDLMTTED